MNEELGAFFWSGDQTAKIVNIHIKALKQIVTHIASLILQSW